MAVVAPPPSLQSGLEDWGPGTNPAHPLAPAPSAPQAPSEPSAPPASAAAAAAAAAPAPSDQMTDIMSYQYPPPPHSGGSDMSLHTPGYHHHMSASFAAMPHAATASLAAVTSATAAPPVTSTTIAAAASISSSSSAAGLGQDPHISPKQRRESLSRSSSVNMKLKRSLSTPVVRPQQANMSQAQAMPSPDHSALGLAAEKRRNKLGYHRTSVACGHCRRRKIRCIPSPADIQGRCVNCIRLKKECSFYPVDQQPPPDTRKNSTSRGSAMAPPSMKTAGGEPFSPDPKMSSSGRFDYGHSGMTNWMSADTSPSLGKPGDLNATWRSYPQESPITPAFSPYTPHAPPHSASWAAPQSDTGARGAPEDLGWSYPPPPPRSLSFGSDTMSNSTHSHGGSHHHQSSQHHSQHSHQQGAYPSISQMTAPGGSARSSSAAYDRKASSASTMPDLYGAVVTTAAAISGVDMPGSTAMDHHVSMSTGGGGYASWQQPYGYGKAGDDAYVGWGDHGATPVSESHAAAGMYYAAGR